MDRPSHEELISAYFDGAATADERREAERLLSENPAARAWHDQLQQMQSSLRSLPSQALPADFAQSVLRRAEQTMLTAATRDMPAADEQFEPSVSTGLPAQSRLRIWIALAVAALVLIAVVLPGLNQRREPNHVALWDAEAAENTSPAVVDAKLSAETDGRRLERLGEAIQPSSPVPADVGQRHDFDYFAKEPASSAGARPGAMGKDFGRFFWAMPPAEPVSNPTPAPPGLSYVYDVSSPEAQQLAVQEFERSLKEQQIVLEDTQEAAASEPIAESKPAREAPPALGGRSLKELKDTDAGPPGDLVYLIEATPTQLGNAINSLDNLAAKPETQQRGRTPAAAFGGEVDLKQNVAGGAGGAGYARGLNDPRSRAAGRAEEEAKAKFENQATFNRSQAVRFSTRFGDETTVDSPAGSPAPAQAVPAPMPAPANPATAEPLVAKDGQAPAPASGPAAKSRMTVLPSQAPAAPPAATAPPAPDSRTARPVTEEARGGLSQLKLGVQQQSAAEPMPPERLQRAVIIFRVVPATEPAAPRPNE